MYSSPGARHDFLRRWDVPPDWEVRTLGTLASVIGGGTPKRDEGRFWRGGTIAWATPSDITNGSTRRIVQTRDYITDAGLDSSAACLLPVGTVLYTSRATIGAKAIAGIPMATNQGFANFVPRDVYGEYLYHLLDLLRPAICRLAAGTTFPEVSKRDIKAVWCALPPSHDEQVAIACVLHACEVATASTRAVIDQARELKRALSQRVLSQGLRGEATKKTSIGPLPRSWQALSLASVALSFQYGLSIPMQEAGALPILRMGNIQNGDVRLSDLKYVTLPAEVTAPYLLRRGDVLFNRTNSQEWVGKVGIYRHDAPSVFASYLIRVFPDPESVDPYYLGHVLSSYAAQCRIKRYATPGVEQVNINATNLGKVVIPVPSGPSGLEQQREIASMFEAAEAVIQRYEAVLETQKAFQRSLSADLLTGRARSSRLLVAT